jgi:hypothetical protein
LLAQQGLRPTTKGGHYAVERAVTAQFKDGLGTFGALRRRRNNPPDPAAQPRDPTRRHHRLDRTSQLHDTVHTLATITYPN